MHKEILLDDEWLFHKGDIPVKTPAIKGPIYASAKTERMKWGPASLYYNDEPNDYRFDVEYNQDRWDKISLPHDYIIQGPVKQENNNALGFFDYVPAWYRKHFYAEASWKDKRVTLLFEGIATVSTVYFNGCLMHHNDSGYNSFEVDISDYIRIGEDNLIAIYTEPYGHEGWWYEGGGIYRHVYLRITEKTCFDLWGVYIAPRPADNGSYRLESRSTLRNEDDIAHTLTVTHHVQDPSGNTILTYSTSPVTILPRDQREVYAEAILSSPCLWDIDSPNLYQLVSELTEDNCIVDENRTRFGCRDYSIDPDNGFILNGRPVKIKGLCMHQDFGITGKAVPDNILKYRVHLMKEMGANGARMSHYVHPAATMDAMDELGMIVMAENRWFESTPRALRELEMLIKRDRNRPSVFIWSMSNEEPYHSTDMGRRIQKTMRAVAKKLDPYRPVTSAVDRPPQESSISQDSDIIGINYHHTMLSWAHETYPHTPIFSSECCATGTTRGWYDDADEKQGRASAYDSDPKNGFGLDRETMWKLVYANPWLFGAYQWVAFEHRGEASWPRLCSASGAIDLYLQKKDAFYQNLSYWSEYPVIHLLPHWNFRGREGEPIRIVAYTNCDKCELFLNGNSCGKVNVDIPGHAEWSIPYTPGNLTVKGYQKGQIVAEDTRKTTGIPYSLKLTQDCPAYPDGKNIALFTCTVIDETGLEIPDASPYVNFVVTKGATIVGTGSDNTDPVPPEVPARKMYAGKILIAIRPNSNSGGFILRARAEALHEAKIEIRY